MSNQNFGSTAEDRGKARKWLENNVPAALRGPGAIALIASLLAEVRAETLQSTETLAYAEAIEKHSFARGKAEGAREERGAVVRYLRDKAQQVDDSWTHAYRIERGDHMKKGGSE